MIASEQWDWVTISYVISGIILLGVAIVPWPTISIRLGFAAFGIAFVAYGFYEASQTTGIEFISPYLLFLPIAGVISAFAYMRNERGKVAGASASGIHGAAGGTSDGTVRLGNSIPNDDAFAPKPLPAVEPGVLFCAECGFWPWPEETVCDNCGAKLAEATVEANKGRYPIGRAPGPRPRGGHPNAPVG